MRPVLYIHPDPKVPIEQVLGVIQVLQVTKQSPAP